MALDPRQVQYVVLVCVVELVPTHLTSSELVRMLSEGRDEGDQLQSAIRALEESDLLREKAGVIKPTKAALHAVEVLTL